METTSHFIINAFDQDLRIIFWNKKCEAYFGLCKEQAIGQKFEDLFPHYKYDEWLCDLKRALNGIEMHNLNRKYDRTNKYYEQRIIPVKDNTGHVIAVLNLVQDID